MNQIWALWNMQVVRFMAMGTLSTGIMLGIYMALNLVLEYQVAYFISYVITVIVSYFLNTLFVFKTTVSLRGFLKFPIVYVVQYVIAAILLELFVRLGFSETFAPIFIIVLLLPLTFWLSRLVMDKK